MSAETWSKERCSCCGAINWVCLGDQNDCTSSMGEEPVLLCWLCRQKSWRIEAEDREGQRLEDADCVLGREKP